MNKEERRKKREKIRRRKLILSGETPPPVKKKKPAAARKTTSSNKKKTVKRAAAEPKKAVRTGEKLADKKKSAVILSGPFKHNAPADWGLTGKQYIHLLKHQCVRDGIECHIRETKELVWLVAGPGRCVSTRTAERNRRMSEMKGGI